MISNKTVTQYAYTTSNREVLYEVVKEEVFDESGQRINKDYSMRSFDRDTGWSDSMDGVTRVLYRLPDLHECPDSGVIVTEGEKDADRVASLGYLATAVANGSWKDVDLSLLKGRDVWITEDNNKTGRDKAQAAAKALSGIAKNVSIVRLPLAADQDVSDWLDAGHTAEDLDKACENAPAWEAPKDPRYDFNNARQQRTSDHNNEDRRGRSWASVALMRSAAELATLSGDRNPTLNAIAYRMGRIIARGWITRSEVESALVNAMKTNGGWKENGPHATAATLKSGIEAGMKEPHEDLTDRDYPGNSGTYEENANQEEKAQEQAAPSPLRFIDMSNWDSEPTPERPWAAEGRIPMRQVFLHTGDGGTGKSLAELQRSCAHVLGRDWFGIKVKQGPAVFLSAEDDKDELHIRLKAIAQHYGTTVGELVAGGLHILDYAGEYCILGAPNRDGIIRPTPLFQSLEEAALRIKPVAVTIDTVADTYAGSEIDRQQTTQFVKMGQRLAQMADCSVALIAHPSVAGIATGTGLSGSTAWHNKVRARAYMKRVPAEDGGDDDLREIKFMKNNYGRQGDSILVRWQAGVFVLENAADNDLKKRAQDRKVDLRFLELMGRYEQQGRPLSENPNSPSNYAPRVFAREAEGEKFSVSLYRDAMERLFRNNEIHIAEWGPPSKRVRRIAKGGRTS